MKIKWESTGEGTPLLLIQGLGYGRWGWGSDHPGSRRPPPGRHLRQPGHRRVRQAGGPYTAAQMAGDALQVLDEAGIDRAHVFGASLGGMIAQELAVPRPSASTGSFSAARRRAARTRCRCPRSRCGCSPRPRRSRPRWRFGASSRTRSATTRRSSSSTRSLRSGSRTRPIRPAGRPRRPRAWDSRASTAEITAPTLILAGTADNVVDYRNAELLAARIPGARVELFDGSGHLFFWEQPDACVTIVNEFLG